MSEPAEDSEFPRTLGKVALRALAAHGITRFDQLTGVSESELLGFHGVGPKRQPAPRVMSQGTTESEGRM